MLWSYRDDFARTIASLSSRRPLSQRDRSFGHGQNNLNDCNHRSIPQAKAPAFCPGRATAAAKAGAFAYADGNDPGLPPGITKKERWKKTHIGLSMTCYMVCLSK